MAVTTKGLNIMVGMENESAVSDGWLLVSPYGDFPHRLGVQRVDKTAAESMVSAFNGVIGTISRWFKGCPLYVGHPDLPGMENEYKDKNAYGVFTKLEARDDGLYGRVALLPEGMDLMEKKAYRFVSPFWGASKVGSENGKEIYAPKQLFSVGLTNRPNILAPMINEALTEDNANNEGNKIMDLAKLIALLGLSEGSDEAACESCITEMKTKLAAAEADKPAMENEKRTLEVRLANERMERAKLLVAGAVQAGRITIAEQPQWLTALGNEAEFDAKSAELAQLKPKVNTVSQTTGLPERQLKMGNEAERRSSVMELVNLKMAQGFAYDAAWAAVKRENPALFDAMGKKN
jgi:hypothetical protein